MKKVRVSKPPDERRQDLLEAAERLLEREEGTWDFTVGDITDEVGVAKGTFYLYFDSKEHLIAVLKERFVESVLKFVGEVFAREDVTDVEGSVDRFLEAVIDFELRHRHLFVMLLSQGMPPQTPKRFGDADRRLRNLVSAAIVAGVDAGVFQVDDPEMTASLLIRGLEGTLLYALVYDDDIDRDRVLAAARQLVGRTLGSRPLATTSGHAGSS